MQSRHLLPFILKVRYACMVRLLHFVVMEKGILHRKLSGKYSTSWRLAQNNPIPYNMASKPLCSLLAIDVFKL